jgi:hypothetical protein
MSLDRMAPLVTCCFATDFLFCRALVFVFVLDHLFSSKTMPSGGMALLVNSLLQNSFYISGLCVSAAGE